MFIAATIRASCTLTPSPCVPRRALPLGRDLSRFRSPPGERSHSARTRWRCRVRCQKRGGWQRSRTRRNLRCDAQGLARSSNSPIVLAAASCLGSLGSAARSRTFVSTNALRERHASARGEAIYLGESSAPVRLNLRLTAQVQPHRCTWVFATSRLSSVVWPSPPCRRPAA